MSPKNVRGAPDFSEFRTNKKSMAGNCNSVVFREIEYQTFLCLTKVHSTRWSVAMQFAPGVKLRLLLVSGLLAVI